MILGKMMDRPLSIPSVIDYAAEVFADIEIVSSLPSGGRRRQSYADTRNRIARLAGALLDLGIKPGDRVATLAWNTHRHFEIYYAAAGIGAVCHTINPRLPTSQIDYIMHHADDAILLYDSDLSQLVSNIPYALRLQGKTVELVDEDEHRSAQSHCYETLVAQSSPLAEWIAVDENSASGLCYTSGTTGQPKGALYSHRSSVLLAFMTIASHVSTCPLGAKYLPVVPMFHVNAWGLPYSAPLGGNGLIMPGNRLDGESLFQLMDAEQVYSAWGVPTIWLGLLDAMDRHGRKPKGFEEVVVGGSAASSQLIERFEEAYGVRVHHAWGMTEMSPVGTSGSLQPKERQLDRQRRTQLKLSQGRRLFGVEMKIVDERGTALPKDGKHAGELLVRGPTIISGYFGNMDADATAFDKEGWFRTGDRACIGADGRLTLIDRIKDLIKSGGEWISSIDLEEAAMRHQGVSICAAIGLPHEKWGERPVLVVVPKAGEPIDLAELRALLAQSLAKWQMPDEIIVADRLPMNATGKVSKIELREAVSKIGR